MNYKNYLLIVLTISSALFTACSNDDDSEIILGNWKERSVFDGIPRSNAVSFTIENNGYMGTGYDGDDYLNDFWEYNIEGDFWAQKADFPGAARTSGVGFSIGTDGFLGIGYDGDDELSDFWKYDASTNTWIQIADFLGGMRRDALGFAVNSTGYVGTGYDGDNDKKDFWKYDPVLDEWSELVGFGGDKRRDATTFTIDGKVYLGTGVSNGLYIDDFWEFDPQTEIWTRKNNLNEEDEYAIMRSNGTGFELNGLGYIATGYNNINGTLGSVWQYSPSSDTWEVVTALEASVRQDAISFSNGSRAFVLLGRTGSLYLDDNYEIFPTEEYDEDD